MSVTEYMEAIINFGGPLSETIVHNFPVSATENLLVVWNEPESQGLDNNFESTLPFFHFKTADAGNIVKDTSRFVRNAKTYMPVDIYEDSGLTKIEVSETDG